MPSNFNEQLKEELDSMLGEGFGDDKSIDDKAEEEAEEEEVLAEETGEEEDAAGQEDSEGAEGGEEAAEGVEEEPAEESTEASAEELTVKEQLENMRLQNEKLMEQVNKLSTIPQHEEVIVEPEQKSATSEEEVTPDYVGELDLDTLAMDKTLLNNVLHNVVQAAINKSVEKMLVGVPNVVRVQIAQQKRLSDAVDDFYEANEDLIPAKKVVAMFTNEVVSEHPDYQLEDVLKEAAKRARDALGLVQQVTKAAPTNEAGRKPALPKKPSSRARDTKPKMTKLEQEIAELL